MPGYACSEATVDQIADNLHEQEVSAIFFTPLHIFFHVRLFCVLNAGALQTAVNVALC
jgi:hypothetical protein